LIKLLHIKGEPMHLLLRLLLACSSSAFANSPVVPKVDLEFWNSDLVVQGGNNCYNYSVNRVTNSFAQPGEASGTSMGGLSCEEVYKAASADLGLEPTAVFPFQGKSDDTLIALVVAPDYDFHWYRRDDNNFWTHKMGATPATDLDDQAKPITSPETADRGLYTEFCGYFRIKNFPVDPHEQNSGHVRVGNMGTLPEQPEVSTVVELLYSGRRNPQHRLRDFLQNKEFASRLTDIQRDLGKAKIASVDSIHEMSRLGPNGFLVKDVEGLIFPKGTTIQIKGTQVLVTTEVRRSMGLSLSRPMILPALKQ
jgi:hypothetical protein